MFNQTTKIFETVLFAVSQIFNDKNFSTSKKFDFEKTRNYE